MKARFQFASCLNSADCPVCSSVVISLHSRASVEVPSHELPITRHSRFIHSAQIDFARRWFLLFFSVVGFCLTGSPGSAQGVQHLSIIQPGGMPGLPVM